MPTEAPQKTLRDLEIEVLEVVKNALILYPKLPAAQLADLVFQESVELGSVLLTRYLVRLINAGRREARAKPETEPMFPGLEHLPQRIVTPEGKRPLLAKATATEIRTYVKSLNEKHRERIAELQELLKIMGKYITHNRGITPAEVARLELGED
jgi:hypothetical protein